MSKPLRILQFSQLINRHDFMDVIIRNADPSKFTILACTFTHESNIQKPEYSKDGFEHISLDLPFNRSGFFKAIFRLSSVIREKKIDVVHAHHYYEAFITSLALLFNRKCKLVITRHYHNELLITTKGMKLKLYLAIEKFVSRRSNVVISPSSQITELLTQYGVPKEKIRDIPYGFNFRAEKYHRVSDDEAASVRAKLGVQNSEILIGNFGRHHPIKGQDVMLRSFAQISQRRSDVRLLMVGDGPFHDTLKKLASEAGLNGKVIFAGWQKELRPYLSAVDAVWHPTLQEAFPQIMIETMALSRPLFITPVSGATDVVKDGVNGFIIPFNEPEVWTERILSAIADKSGLASVGASARSSVMSYDIDLIIKKIEAVYLECA